MQYSVAQLTPETSKLMSFNTILSLSLLHEADRPSTRAKGRSAGVMVGGEGDLLITEEPGSHGDSGLK